MRETKPKEVVLIISKPVISTEKPRPAWMVLVEELIGELVLLSSPWEPVEARKGADLPWTLVACRAAGWRRDHRSFGYVMDSNSRRARHFELQTKSIK
ncbi:hypothetical protein LI82_11265 [Methanococcoides methylutens]|uniref:Uncharacterized protein n=1 Tax=Methanococcoides methylutens TaxID=2226 RepID=A0A099T2A5_METMT|nr:hypothetical protein LI82_11265 [Methanococcoides methylutens]